MYPFFGSQVSVWRRGAGVRGWHNDSLLLPILRPGCDDGFDLCINSTVGSWHQDRSARLSSHGEIKVEH